MHKLVSVITPTFNCGAYILETIRSVQAQTFDNWEMIIVDDCSTDDTKEIVGQACEKDPRIKYVRLKTNSGAAVARTEAMKLAKGNYMAFLDSDDLWKPEKLEKQLAFMEENRYPFTATAYEKIDESGRKLNKIVNVIDRTSYNRLLLDCPIGNSTVMYDVDKMGKFEVPNIKKRNDDALWLKMLKQEKYIYCLHEVLMEYRVRSNSISSNKLSLVKYHWKLYREIEHLSVLRSAFHIVVWGALKIFHIK